jgi:predicted ATPase with chaperone activity
VDAGGHLDLAIALDILAANSNVPREVFDDYRLIALALSRELRGA